MNMSYDGFVKEHAVNGYEIRWNEFWHMWQVSHPEIGAMVAEFKRYYDALEYCING